MDLPPPSSSELIDEGLNAAKASAATPTPTTGTGSMNAGSKRQYAAQRVQMRKEYEARVRNATDVKRLEWEIKVRTVTQRFADAHMLTNMK